MECCLQNSEEGTLYQPRPFQTYVVSKYDIPTDLFQEATREQSPPNAGLSKPKRQTHGT